MAPPKKISPAEQEAEPQAHSEEEKENLTEEESDDEEEEEDFEPDMIIRAKWCIDGAETLDQVVEHLQDFIRYVERPQDARIRTSRSCSGRLWLSVQNRQ